jgi:hypothetical protein
MERAKDDVIVAEEGADGLGPTDAARLVHVKPYVSIREL